MKYLVNGLLILFLFLQGCKTEGENPCSLLDKTWSEFREIDSLLKVPEFKQQYEERMRIDYDESPIFIAEHEMYRLFISCSGYGSYTKIVRIEKLPNDQLMVTIKEFDRTTEDLKTQKSKRSFEISANEWDSFINEITNSNFWTSITSCNKELLHGCTWTIDGFNPEKHPCTLNNYHRIGGCYPVEEPFKSLYDRLNTLEEKE